MRNKKKWMVIVTALLLASIVFIISRPIVFRTILNLPQTIYSLKTHFHCIDVTASYQNYVDEIESFDQLIKKVEFTFVRSNPVLQINLYTDTTIPDACVYDEKRINVIKELIYYGKADIQGKLIEQHEFAVTSISLNFITEGESADYRYDYSYKKNSWTFFNDS